MDAINLSPMQRSAARHALGLPNSAGRTWRNHFVTGEGSTDHRLWMRLVDRGLARRMKGSPLTGGDDLFSLNRTGAQAALNLGESLDPEDFPV